MTRLKKHWLIALAVAIVYLALSLLLDGWAWTWLLWVAYAAYRFLKK